MLRKLLGTVGACCGVAWLRRARAVWGGGGGWPYGPPSSTSGNAGGRGYHPVESVSTKMQNKMGAPKRTVARTHASQNVIHSAIGTSFRQQAHNDAPAPQVMAFSLNDLGHVRNMEIRPEGRESGLYGGDAIYAMERC